MMSAPPISFFWNKKLKDMSFGKDAFGKIVHDHELTEPYTEKPRFYIEQEYLK